MNLFQKILFRAGIVITMVSLFACATEAVDEARFAIADFDLLPGYTFEFSTSMLGYTVASYTGPNGPSHLYLIQSEQGSDGDELAKMLAQLVPGAGDPNAGTTVIENRPATIRGQEVTLIVSEGVNSENVSYRQVTAAFQGKGGPALLVFSGTVDAWDQAAVDEFLASIR
jgi:hypothetical protein